MSLLKVEISSGLNKTSFNYFSSLSLESQDNESVTLDLPSDRHQPGSNKQFLRKKTRPRSSSVYRMASTFELGDEQVFKRNEKKENGRDFGNYKYHCKFIMIMASPKCLYVTSL